MISGRAERLSIPTWLPDGLYQVTKGGLCAGLLVAGGRVVMCAPILRQRLDYWAGYALMVSCPVDDGGTQWNMSQPGEASPVVILMSIANIMIRNSGTGLIMALQHTAYPWLRRTGGW